MPRVSSRLENQPAPADGQSSAPAGRLILCVGTAGRGPTTPQAIDSPADAERTYGTQGSLLEDIELAFRGARFAAATANTQQEPNVVAIRADTGKPATAKLKSGGNRVITFRTANSGEQANDWSLTVKENSVVLNDPETGQTAQFTFDPTGQSSGIQTPSDLVEAITETTSGRIVGEVHRGHTHFEMKVAEPDLSTLQGIDIESTDAQTSVDFSEATITDMGSATKSGVTAIGGDTNAFDSNPDVPVHNAILPQDTNVRIYAITAGKVQSLAAGQENHAIERLADSSRISVDTNTLLNLREDGSAGRVGLSSTGQRDGSVISEAYERVRKQYVGRLDMTDETAAGQFAEDYTVAVATDAGFSTKQGQENASSPLTVSGVDVTDGDLVLRYGSADGSDGLYKVRGDGSGNFYIDTNRHRTGTTLAKEGAVLDVGAGDVTGLKQYDAETGTLADPKALAFSFDAPRGVADQSGSGAGPLAEAYATEKFGDATKAAEYSVDRLTPEGVDRFEANGDAIDVFLAPVTDPQNATKYEGDISMTYADGEVELMLDKAELSAELDNAIVYVSYDSCIFDLREVGSESLLGGGVQKEYTVDGQQIVFDTELENEIVVRPLRVTQYTLGNDVQVQRTGDSGNRFTFLGAENQPGAAGEAIGNVETILGFEYDYEPAFPPASQHSFSGATPGTDAGPIKTANAIEDALQRHSNVDHDFLVISELFVDEMTEGKDPVTGAPVRQPAGVLQLIDRHQARMDASGASPVAFTSVRPMEESTATGRYTPSQKADRINKLTNVPDAGNVNAASIIQSADRPEVFIFDTPMVVTLSNGRTIETSSPALWAGMRSVIPNTQTLHRIDVSSIAEPVYKYDVAGQNMPARIAAARVNTWANIRSEARLEDEQTAAGELVTGEGRVAPSGWQTGIALLAAKEFQQEAIEDLETLLGGVPEGGIDVLKGTAETMIQGTAQRTTGVEGFKLNADQDIKIKAEGGNSLGMYISVRLQVAGEVDRIDLSVGAVQVSGGSGSDEPAIPQAS